MILGTPNESWKKLDLIDTIQRLGVSYQFETEIGAALGLIYKDYDHHDSEYDEKFKQENGNELHTTALRFRLLRQHGYDVSSDVFKKFKDPEGNFKESLSTNTRGLLSLYEAANYRIHGEEILEEALNYSTSQLEKMLPSLDNLLASQVKQALDVPIQKALTRMRTRQFISLYQEDKSHDPSLLNFAKYDFKILQKLHQEEVSGITKWWKGLDCPKNIPFARDRVVECFLWIIGVYFEPKYSVARTRMTKVIALASILDDLYDVYGTVDELILFTDSLDRWHISELDGLPEYMRPCYQGLLDVCSEIETGSSKKGKKNPANYAISSLKTLARAYLEEAKWVNSKYVPEFDEYMELALVTCTHQMLATNALACMGDIVSEDALDWVSRNPLILKASSMICRLMDDIVSYEAEKERGELASAIECYMIQYGVSREEAIAELEKRITNAWKDTNRELLIGEAPEIPMLVLERVLNLSKVIHLLYRHEDGYTNAFTVAKDMITQLLVDPVDV
ncbi:OLC1v1022881C4 [Oldenlandia corymbosa var. corymbosa]|nr:OLC1v1022881C4 [Oldenlandia corymbosa var. corymbosa]